MTPPDEPDDNATDPDDQPREPADTVPSRTPSTESVNLARNYTPDDEDADEDDLNPRVEKALKPGLERGTIRESEEPLDPPDDSAYEQMEADADADADAETTTTTTTTHSTTEAPDDEIDQSDIPNVSGEELDLDTLATDEGEAEWTWGQKKPTRTFSYKGMQVVMTEPEDDDEILNHLREQSMTPGEEDDQTQIDHLKAYAQLVIDHPAITDERWEHHMTPTERLTIGSMAAQYLEGEDFTDASEGGPTPPQA